MSSRSSSRPTSRQRLTCAWKLWLLASCAAGCNRASDDAKHPRQPAVVGEPEPPPTQEIVAPQTVLELVRRLAGMETLSRPDPHEVARLAGGGLVKATESPTSFEVTTTFDGVRVLVDAGALPQVRCSTELRSGVKLADLSAAFGAPKTLVESKTSSVVYNVTQGARHVLVFVTLFTPKVSDASPVLSITLRRGEDR